MYILIDNGTIKEYPYTISKLRKDNPHTSFPLVPSESQLVVWGVSSVVEITPDVTEYQRVLPVTTPELIGAVWTLQHTIEDIPTEEIAADKLRIVTMLHKSKRYSDITATFPAGDAVIQFRDEDDRANLSNVASGALALIVAGQSSAEMVYRTADNINQTVTAGEMLVIAQGVMAAKQAIIEVCWAHKDALKALLDSDDRSAIIAYDINAGW